MLTEDLLAADYCPTQSAATDPEAAACCFARLTAGLARRTATSGGTTVAEAFLIFGAIHPASRGRRPCAVALWAGSMQEAVPTCGSAQFARAWADKCHPGRYARRERLMGNAMQTIVKPAYLSMAPQQICCAAMLLLCLSVVANGRNVPSRATAMWVRRLLGPKRNPTHLTLAASVQTLPSKPTNLWWARWWVNNLLNLQAQHG